MEFEQTLPVFEGKPISLSFRPRLTAVRGRLHSGKQGGKAVWAGSFIRRRSTVLDRELLDHEPALRGILIHELFHFAWVRAGNPTRRSFAALLAVEVAGGARGELGESSEAQKLVWRAGAYRRHGTNQGEGSSFLAGSRAWSEYVCESFCDTAAWMLCRRAPWPISLAERWRRRRRVWFREWIGEQAGVVRV